MTLGYCAPDLTAIISRPLRSSGRLLGSTCADLFTRLRRLFRTQERAANRKAEASDGTVAGVTAELSEEEVDTANDPAAQGRRSAQPLSTGGSRSIELSEHPLLSVLT
jgi:hypothetical protein